MGFVDRLTSETGGNIIVFGLVSIIFGFVLLQTMSIILTQLFGIQQLTLGPSLGLFAIASALVNYAVTSIRVGTSWKDFFIAAGMGVLMYVLFFMLLPSQIPSIYDAQGILAMRESAMSLIGI